MDKLIEKAKNMSNENLQIVWQCLSGNTRGYLSDGITMEQWAEVIYSEMSRRNLPTS